MYKRPGPPTPSKNGGRLSFGGTELPRGDILKESNNNREISSDSIVNKKITPNKTGRQFRSIFSSKGKDEVCLIKILFFLHLFPFSIKIVQCILWVF